MSDKKPTLEDVWALFQEIGARIKELTADSGETKARFKDIEARFKDTDAQGKAIDARIDKVTRAIDRLSGNMGGLSKKWGNLGEAMTIGESLPIFNKINGITVHSLHPNVTSNYSGKELEIDGLAIGKDVVIVIEAKATMKKDDVRDFVNKKLKVFTQLEPIYKGQRIYGAMGFLSANGAVQEYAQTQGILLIRPRGESKELVPLPEGFKLRNFHP